MHKKAITLALLAASVAAVATTVPPVKVTRLEPMALQSSSSVAQPSPAPAARPMPQVDVAQGIARWHSLRQTDNLPFSSYASFLTTYRGWPGESALRRTAERAIDPNGTPPAEVVSYFRVHPPLTAAGHARHAFALHATGRVEEARQAARTAWHMGVLPRNDEDRLLALFSASLLPQDHDVRMEALLANGDTQSAQRVLGYASAARRPIYDARLALQTRAPDAVSKLAAIGTAATSDPGVILDRAQWLRNTGQSLASRNLLAQPRALASRPHDPAKWFEGLLQVAKAAANDRQWSTVYQIASQLDDAYAPGTDVSAQDYDERDHYTSLAWLAGTTALHRLNRPADAARMFERYGLAARSPQTRAKGFYWAGRALAQAGQGVEANRFFEQAAASPDQYYGQLALERLGRTPPPPADAQAAAPSAADRAAFAANSLAETIRFLGRQGRWNDQSLFIRALAEQLETDQHRALAGELAQQVGRPDIGVWVARQARSQGDNFYARSGFPEVNIPPAYARHWTLSHAIMRQESSFDRAAVSHAGARGMMQLMPATARETAGKIGLSYDYSRLTEDPTYNIMLGSAYFANLLDRWGGNVPLAVASYNAGAGNVSRWVRENGDPRMPGVDTVRWIEEIPYSETRNYVQRVLENAVVYDVMHPQRARSPANMRLSYYLGKNQPG